VTGYYKGFPAFGRGTEHFANGHKAQGRSAGNGAAKEKIMKKQDKQSMSDKRSSVLRMAGIAVILMIMAFVAAGCDNLMSPDQSKANNGENQGTGGEQGNGDGQGTGGEQGGNSDGQGGNGDGQGNGGYGDGQGSGGNDGNGGYDEGQGIELPDGWDPVGPNGVVAVREVHLNVTEKTMVQGETLEITVTVVPVNASVLRYEWYGANYSYVLSAETSQDYEEKQTSMTVRGIGEGTETVWVSVYALGGGTDGLDGITTTAECVITVKTAVSNITVDTANIAAYYGEPLDLTGRVTAAFTDGTSDVVAVSAENISGFDCEKTGSQTVTVTYGGMASEPFPVYVKTLTGISVTGIYKNNYTIGDPDLGLIAERFQVTAQYEGSVSRPVALDRVAISEFDLTAGVKTITVTYYGKTAAFTVAVNPRLERIVIAALPAKTDYLVGEPADWYGLQVDAVYYNGNREETKQVTVGAGGISGFYSYGNLGEQTITVTFGGKTATFTVTVWSFTLTLVSLPHKTDYFIGESAVWDGLSVIAVHDNGTTTKDVPVPISGNISGFDSATAGEKVIIVTYGGRDVRFLVTIGFKITGVTVTTAPPKEMVKGGSAPVSVVVHAAQGIPPQTVTWSVVGEEVPGTSIASSLLPLSPSNANLPNTPPHDRA
jgi:hypothetical protein